MSPEQTLQTMAPMQDGSVCTVDIISLKCVKVCISGHFASAKRFHPPGRCDMNRCWFKSVIIAQVCLGCRGVIMCLLWPLLASRSAKHFHWAELIELLILASGKLVHSASVAVAGYWQESEPVVILIHPMHPKQRCVVSMLAMLELECFQLPEIVHRSLQHGVATAGDGSRWKAGWRDWGSHYISAHSNRHQ